MLDTPGPEPLRSPLLDQMMDAGIRHGFFTRAGGVSTGLYKGLNVGIGSRDDPSKVRENRSRVARWVGVAETHLNTAFQIHSADAVVAHKPFFGERPRGDALVTDRPGIAIGVLAADCGPVLFADGEAQVIGAAHAGWQGALKGVLENTIETMEKLGARRERIVAALGPSISQANYEVGPDFVERFLAADARNERYFLPSQRPGHAMFDLRGYSVDRLRAAGVRAEMLDRCTYADEDLFFSYRRATHRNEADYGRQISAIVIEDR